MGKDEEGKKYVDRKREEGKDVWKEKIRKKRWEGDERKIWE